MGWETLLTILLIWILAPLALTVIGWVLGLGLFALMAYCFAFMLAAPAIIGMWLQLDPVWMMIISYIWVFGIGFQLLRSH
jgi:hypothetical protein